MENYDLVSFHDKVLDDLRGTLGDMTQTADTHFIWDTIVVSSKVGAPVEKQRVYLAREHASVAKYEVGIDYLTELLKNDYPAGNKYIVGPITTSYLSEKYVTGMDKPEKTISAIVPIVTVSTHQS